jgi:arylsulfatase B
MLHKLFLWIAFLCMIQNVNAQRNVVLLIADDIGTDYFGFYEDAKDTVAVPNIRKLLNKGICFNNGMTNPVCSSTRANMLTGRYSFRTGVGYIVGSTQGSGVLDTAEITIPKQLSLYNASIKSANIGKWHLHNAMPNWNLQNPQRLGYHHFEGPFIGAINSYTNWTKYTNGVASTVTTYATTENVNNAISWIKNQGNNPFFLWMAFNAPHSPYHLPPNNLHSYSLSGTSMDIAQNPKNYFKAAIQALDTEIGRLMDSLQVINKLDSTDFIFVGDNGNAMQTAQISNINKAKGTVYQYGVHTPLIIAGPSVVNAGRISNALVNVADIYATVIELFGQSSWQNNIPSNKPVDSKSILPIIKNLSDSIRPWSFCEIFRNTADADDGKALRNQEYKLIRFDNGQEEFYNLNIDAEENTNLLLGNLSSADLSNYYILCNALTTLVGNGNFCTAGLSIPKQPINSLIVRQNPFIDYIKLPITSDNKMVYRLYNALGVCIFEGVNIQYKNFSALPSGVYLLKCNDAYLQLKKE